MIDYVYGGILVADAVTFRRATNAACTVYDVNDMAEATPLALKDPSGVALPNPITSSGDAFLPPLVTTSEGIKVVGGGLTVVVYSHAGMQAAAQEAAEAAQGAANDAATAAGLAVAGASVNGAGELVIQQASGATLNAGPVKGSKGDKGDKGDKGTDGANVLPTDAAIAQALQDPNSQTRAAGNATYASKAERPHIDVDAQKLPSDPDDTLAWQRAVSLAISSGVKRVRGKSAVYNCSGQINYAGASGLVIEGSGMGATVINVSGTAAPVEALFYTSGSASDVIFQDMTIKGQVVDDVTAPRRSRTYSGPGMNSAIVAYGDFNPHNATSSVVKNIRLRHLRILGCRGLPFQFDGVRGYAQAIDVETELTMDGGWVSAETVVFDKLRSYKSADNGFSISRDCKRVIGGSVYVEMAAYYGLWLSGFIVNNDATDLGPNNFLVDLVNVKNVGMGGLKMDDGPSNGRVNTIFVDGVSRGPVDGPSSAGGIGILVGGYPSTNRAAPTNPASQITIGTSTLINCQRGGALLTGATDITLNDILIINPGSQYKEDGTTVISPADNTQNFGVAVDSSNAGTVVRPFVRNLRVIDNRATPYANFPIYLTGSVSPGYANVSAFGCRQTYFSDNLTETLNGAKVFQLPVKDVGGATAGSSSAAGTVSGYDVNGAAGSTRRHKIQSGGSDRWQYGGTGDAESGSNVGTDFVLNAYDDAGLFLATTWRATRKGAHTIGVQGQPVTFPARLVSGAASITGVTAGAQASTAAAAGNGANDTAGTLNVTAAASPAAGTLVTVSFATAYAATPHVVITPQNQASAQCQPYVTRSSTGFTIACAAAPGASASLSFDYHVMG